MTFGETLVAILEERGMNINQLSEQTGIPRQSLYSLVYGKAKEPTLGRAKRICDALGLTLDELWGRMQG